MAPQIPALEACDLFIRSLQGSLIKSLVEVLKDVIFEATLVVTDSMIKITTMDSSKSSLIYLKLDAANFEQYHCSRPQRLGVSMINLFKIIKMASHKQDILSLFVEKNTPYELGLVIENEEKRSQTVFHLSLLDLDSQDIQIPEFHYRSILTLPSSMFHRLCRDMHQLSGFVTMETHNSCLTLSCKGDFAKQATTFSPNDDDKENVSIITTSEDDDVVVRGTFSLKYLCLFGRTAALSQMVTVYLKEDHPLLLEYNIGSLGKLIFLLTPLVGVDMD